MYWEQKDREGSLFLSPLWLSGAGTNGDSWRMLTPIFYQSSNAIRTTLVTPLWARGHSATNDWQAVIPLAYWDREQHTLISPLWAHWQMEDRERDVAPWLLSWKTRDRERSDLWLAAGVAHASWGERPGSHHVLPFYFRDAAEQTLLTPVCGWDRKEGFFYPFTPLAGVRNGAHRGSWLFPIYNHSREKKTGDVRDIFLLAGGCEKTKSHRSSWFYPFFGYDDHGPVDRLPEQGRTYGSFGKEFWCLPYCWSFVFGTGVARGAGPVSGVGRNVLSMLKRSASSNCHGAVT